KAVPRSRPPSPPAVTAPATRPSRLRIVWALAVFAVVFIGECVFSYTQKSATWDEPIHLADGYASLFRHDYRYDPEHPPFLRMFAALPLVSLPEVRFDTTAIDRDIPENWAITDLYAHAHQTIYVDNDADRMLYRARFMIVCLGVLLGGLLFA